MVYIELVQAITSIFIHGFQNNVAQLLICSDKLKVKVTLEVQTIKWSLACVNIINLNFWFINIKKVCCLSMMLFGICPVNE